MSSRTHTTPGGGSHRRVQLTLPWSLWQMIRARAYVEGITASELAARFLDRGLDQLAASPPGPAEARQEPGRLVATAVGEPPLRGIQVMAVSVVEDTPGNQAAGRIVKVTQGTDDPSRVELVSDDGEVAVVAVEPTQDPEEMLGKPLASVAAAGRKGSMAKPSSSSLSGKSTTPRSPKTRQSPPGRSTTAAAAIPAFRPVPKPGKKP